MFSLSKILWSTVYRCTNQNIEFSVAQNTNQSATVNNKTHARVIKTYWYSYSSPCARILYSSTFYNFLSKKNEYGDSTPQ